MFENRYPKWLFTMINSLMQPTKPEHRQHSPLGLKSLKGLLVLGLHFSCFWVLKFLLNRAEKRLRWKAWSSLKSAKMEGIISISSQFLEIDGRRSSQIDVMAIAQLHKQITPSLANTKLEFYCMQLKRLLPKLKIELPVQSFHKMLYTLLGAINNLYLNYVFVSFVY